MILWIITRAGRKCRFGNTPITQKKAAWENGVLSRVPLQAAISNITSRRQSWNSLLLVFLFLYLPCLIWKYHRKSRGSWLYIKTSFVPRLMFLFSWLLWCCTWVLVWCLALNYPLSRQKFSWPLLFSISVFVFFMLLTTYYSKSLSG